MSNLDFSTHSLCDYRLPFSKIPKHLNAPSCKPGGYSLSIKIYSLKPPPVASCELPPVLVLEEVAVLLAAAICHAGIAALPDGAPVLNGLAARP
jgi:hypothetical protein